MKYLFKKYDKYKIECLFSNPQVFVISNQRVRIKDVDGKIIDVSLLEVLNQFLPSQEYFNLDTKYIRENFNIILNDALSDKSQNLYVLECIPKIFNSGTFKIEMCVDCSKGISVRNRIYKEANILIGVSEVKESRLIDDIWIPISIEYTIFPSEGQEIKVTKRFESVQVNTGIPDSEFEIE